MDQPFDPSLAEELLLMGAIEAAGVDEEGKITYKFTENAKDIAPELYSHYMDNFYSDLMTLWQKGFISMDVTEQNPKVTVVVSKFTDDEAVASLTQKERNTLYFVVAAMKDK